MPQDTVRQIPLEYPFPIGGIDQAAPRSKQKGGTCSSALNVRSRPPLSDRQGGGKRGGTIRAFTDALEGVTGYSPRVIGLDVINNGLSAGPGGTPISAYWRPNEDVAEVTLNGGISRTGAATDHECWDEEDADDATTMVHLAGGLTAGVYAEVGLEDTADPGKDLGFQLHGRYRSNDSNTPARAGTGTLNGQVIDLVRQTATHATAIGHTQQASEEPAGSDPTEPADPGGTLPGDPRRHWIEFQLRQGANTLIATTGAMEHLEINTGVWIEFDMALTQAEGAAITDFTDLRIRVIVTTDGSQTVGFEVTQTYLRCTGDAGTPNLASVGNLVLALQYSKAWVGDLASDTLVECDPDDLGPQNQVPSIASLSGLWYIVDGSKSLIVDPAAGPPPTIVDWTSTDGTFPASCKLVTQYRLRMALANQDGSETMWFMARPDFPRDFDYLNANANGPEASAATYGGDPNVGRPGDTITALIAWGQDYLVFGCAHSIYYLEGDPLYGSGIQNMTHKTGILGARAWTFDEGNRLWFLGQGDLFVVVPGAQPRPVTRGRLARSLERLDADVTLLQLQYDAFSQLIHIFTTPTDNVSRGVHIVYDLRNDALWMDAYPLRMGPWSCCSIAGTDPFDRRFLIGGDDGRIRRPSDSVYGDDVHRDETGGSAIFSYVRYAPLGIPGGMSELMVLELQAEGSDSQGPLALEYAPLRWCWLTAETAAKLSEADPSTGAFPSGFWFEDDYGLQDPIGLRETAGAHQLYVEQQSAEGSWALDTVRINAAQAGRRGR
jgi:hypothetical protein